MLSHHEEDSVQIVLDGMVNGLAIALLALAFAIVYLPTRVFHLALGGVYAAVPYVAWSSISAGLPWPAAVGAALVVGVLLSLSCEAANHAPLARRKAPPGIHLVSALGIYIAVSHLLALVWGSESRSLRVGLDVSWQIGSMALTRAQLSTAAVTVALIILFHVWLKFSDLGLQIRALADNPSEFVLLGLKPRRLRIIAFSLAGMLASAAGLLAAFDLGFDPYTGLNALLLAVVAVMIGGRESFVGPVMGGLTLGLVRVAVAWFLSAAWQDGVTYLVLALFLFLRPLGIASRTARLEHNL